MVDADLDEFATLLDSVCALLSRGQYTPSDASTILFFRKLAAYPMPAVRRAFDQHVEQSKFPPTPAEVIDILQAADGRVAAEEAWAIALTARDERDSVVWTNEIAQAWNIAQPVYQQGDEVGARMAFREAYGRLVHEARAERRANVWLLSEGHDAARRTEALRIAVDKGRAVSGMEHMAALPAPTAVPPLLLGGPGVAAPESARAALKALRDRLANRSTYTPGPDVEARQRTQSLQAEQAERVAVYEQRTGVAA